MRNILFDEEIFGSRRDLSPAVLSLPVSEEKVLYAEMDKLYAERITLAGDQKRHSFHKRPTEFHQKFDEMGGYLACSGCLVTNAISDSFCQGVDAQGP